MSNVSESAWELCACVCVSVCERERERDLTPASV